MRQPYGTETWKRLLEWDKGQTPAERLCALILNVERYQGIDPSHPLGGRDGLKDIVLHLDRKKFVAACYFPRGNQKFNDIKKKFSEDYKGVAKNSADGFIFLTNQELTLSERQKLIDIVDDNILVEIYHLERIASRIDTPECYGIRLEYLQITMTQEEQVAHTAILTQHIKMLNDTLKNSNSASSEKSFPQRITPIVYHQSSSFASGTSSTNFYSPLHRCTNCNFGMLIDFPSSGYASASLVVGTPTSKSYVQCPNCGNVDELPGRIY